MNKIEFDIEINKFEQMLKELRTREDIRKSVSYDTIRCLLEIITRLKTQLARETFFTYVEQALDIKLSDNEKDYILGHNSIIRCSMVREDLIDCIKLAYNGEDVVFNFGSNSFRLIKVPIGHTYKYNGVSLPSNHLVETMNKLYGNNWRYAIK